MTVFLIILSVILIIIDFLIFCPISIKLVYDNDIKRKRLLKKQPKSRKLKVPKKAGRKTIS